MPRDLSKLEMPGAMEEEDEMAPELEEEMPEEDELEMPEESGDIEALKDEIMMLPNEARAELHSWLMDEVEGGEEAELDEEEELPAEEEGDEEELY